MNLEKIKSFFNNNASVIGITILFLTFVPIIEVYSYAMPVLYLLIPFEIVLLIYMLYNKKNLPRFFYITMWFFILISFEIIISTFHGTIKFFDTFVFPTDIIQYVARFLIMWTFFYFAYYKKMQPSVFIKFFLIIMNIGMLIGILQ